jgi:hypothetical protein
MPELTAENAEGAERIRSRILNAEESESEKWRVESVDRRGTDRNPDPNTFSFCSAISASSALNSSVPLRALRPLW